MKRTKHHRPANRQLRRQHQTRCPPLRLTPYAWAKLLTLRDLGETEVGAFGVSRPGDPLLVADVQLVEQVCTAVTVQFDDVSVADYYDRQVDAGRTPDEFARIWIHTHPANSAYPSSLDEETFSRCFGVADWAIMLILARGGQTYARLRYRHAPSGEYVLPVRVDFTQDFPASDRVAWEIEYGQNVACARLDQRAASVSYAWDELPPWESVWRTQRDVSDCVGLTGVAPFRMGEFCDA